MNAAGGVLVYPVTVSARFAGVSSAIAGSCIGRPEFIFAADMAAVQGLQAKLIHVKHELLEIPRQRATASIDLWDKVKGVRSATKIVCSNDSTAYEFVGGTRRSDRKKPRRRSLPESPEG